MGRPRLVNAKVARIFNGVPQAWIRSKSGEKFAGLPWAKNMRARVYHFRINHAAPPTALDASLTRTLLLNRHGSQGLPRDGGACTQKRRNFWRLVLYQIRLNSSQPSFRDARRSERNAVTWAWRRCPASADSTQVPITSLTSGAFGLVQPAGSSLASAPPMGCELPADKLY